MGRLALSTRFSVGVALLVGLTALASTGLIFVRLDQALVEAEVVELERATEVRATLIADRVSELVRDVRLLSGTPPVQGLIRARQAGGVDPLDGTTSALWRDRLSVIFDSTLRTKPTYLQVRYIGFADGGRELVRVDRDAQGRPQRTPDEALQQKGHSHYVRRAQETPPGQVSLSQIDLNREHGAISLPHAPVLRAMCTVADPSGAPFGAVVLNLDLRETFAEVLRGTAPEHRYTLSDERNHFLLHPDPQRAFGFEFGRPGDARTDLPLLATLGDRVSQTAVLRSGHVLSVRRVHLEAAQVPRWIDLAIETSSRAATAVSRRVAGEALFLVGVLCVLAIGVGHGLARIAARPVTDLVRAVRGLDLEASPGQLPQLPGATPEAEELARVLSLTFARLQRRTRELAAKNRELEQFAYVAAHDLQEPVRTISSFVALLEQQDLSSLNEPGRQSLKFITESCARMRELIQALLDYGRLGKQTEPSTVDLTEVAEQALTDLRATIEERGAEVEVGALPTLARGLAPELRALLQNLIGNALKFSRPGAAPRVQVLAERDATDGVVLTVQDDGIGIPPQHRARVFRLFQRLHAREDYAGTGIGLAHCHKIAELHRGRIWIEDSPLGGACFKVLLRDVARPAAPQEGA
ncbi:MAG: ATP-binding protein [Planctomycetota bacterium]